jgi:hypothetical protein
MIDIHFEDRCGAGAGIRNQAARIALFVRRDDLLTAGSDIVVMRARTQLAFLTVIGAIALAAAPAAPASTANVEKSVSSNWAGYVAGGSGATTSFSSVSGSWVEPSVTVGAGDSYSVFWVGLGGSGGVTNALEQVGTEADYVHGKAQYSAWYELVPNAPVKLQLTIRPGDGIYAQVSVSGTNVTVSLADQTTGQWAKQTLQMSNPDTASAEWIAEAPSTCDGSGSCQPLPLANFGTVQFDGATATANGHTGSITDPNWTAQAVRLNATANEGGAAGPGFVSEQLADGAEPSTLSSDGSSFSVAYLASSSQIPTVAGTQPAIDGFPGPGPWFSGASGPAISASSLQ